METEILAVIPARGGSKSVPRKNIKVLAGKPMIAWTVEAARARAAAGRTVVTTDSAEIADVAKRFGAEVPFLRPAELAADDTPGMAPILHAIRWLADHEGYRPEYVVVLQPTSPLRTAADIDGAVGLALERRADAVVSVTDAPRHPLWFKRLDEQGRLADYNPDQAIPAVRQELPEAYALNGAVYLARREVLLERQTWYTDETYGYVMPRERSLDVDDPWDFYLAELIMRDRLAGGPS